MILEIVERAPRRAKIVSAYGTEIEVPYEANYIAIDVWGMAYAYINKPYICVESWDSSGYAYYCGRFALGGEDWRNTLVEI